MQDDNKLEEFRKSLEKANYAVPDSATFAETLGDPVKAKAFHGALIKDNYNVPEDFEIFSSSLGLKKKDLYKDLGFGRDLVQELFGEGYSKEDREVSKKPEESELPVLEEEINFKKLATPNVSLKKIKDGFEFPQTDLNDVLSNAILNAPEREEKPTLESYLTALPQGFNQRMGEAIRNMGTILNAPKEALASGVAKIAGKGDSANEKYLRQAFSDIPILGQFSQENMDQLATAIEHAGNPKAIPNDIIGKTLASTGSILFDIMAIRTPPVPKLNALAKYGMERVPMFPTYLGAMEGAKATREGKPLGESAKLTAEGIISGLTYEGMGVTAGRVGQLVKELGGGQVLSTTSKALANSALFGTDSKVKGGSFLEGAAIGAVFGGYDLTMEGINRSIAHRAYVSYLTATDNNIRTIAKMQVDPAEMRKQSDQLWLDYEKETDPAKKEVILEEKTAVDNILNVNAMTQEIIKNPSAFTDAIMADEKLSEKEKKAWTAKISNTVANADPRIMEAQPLVSDLKTKEAELKYWQEDSTVDPVIKESKIEAVTNQIEGQKEAIAKTMEKPLEDYAPEKKPEGKKKEGEKPEDKIFNKQDVVESLLQEVPEESRDMMRSEFTSLDRDKFNAMAEQAGFNSFGSYWTRSTIAKGAGKKSEEVEKKETEEKVPEVAEEPLTVEGKTFASEEELFKYLDENAIDKETKGIKEGWMATKELPNEATMKAVNKWEEAKGIVRKPQSVMKEETPEQKSDRILNRLADLQKQYNETPGNFKSRRREMLSIMQRLMGEAPDAKYTLQQEGKNVKILKNGKGLKRTAWKQENRKLADIEEGEFKDFVNTMLGARGYLVDLDAPIGPKLMDKAIEDLLAGKANQNSEYLMKALEESFRSGQLLYKVENKPPRPITVKEVMSEMANEKLTKFVEEQGELSIDNIDKAVEYGLIDKKDVETVKKVLQDENTERARLESEWAEEETQALAGIDKERTETVKDQGKTEGKGEVEPKKEADEAQAKEQINRPDIESGKGEGDNVPGSTEPSAKPIEAKGEGEPAKPKYPPEQQKKVDAINKEYDEKIADAKKELEGMTDEARQKVIDKATKEIDKRNTLFGDANAKESDLIKPEDQGFEVSRKPIEEATRKFDERKVELNKQIDALNKERESKIGEVVKQSTFDWESMFRSETPEEKAISDVRTKEQENVKLEAEYQKSSFDKKWAPTREVAISKLKQTIADAEARIADWSSRVYRKSGGKTVEVGKDNDFDLKSVDVDRVNEKRRQQVIKGARDEIAEARKDLKTLGFEEPSKKEYKYKMTLRPFDIGTYPKEGFVKSENDPEGGYQILTYDRPLTAKERSHWSFLPLTEISEMKGKDFVDKDGEFSVKLDWMGNNKGADVSMYDAEGKLVEKPFYMGIEEIMKNVESGYWVEKPKTETPKKTKEEGIKFKDKYYTEIDQVQDDFADGKLTIDEQRDLLEKVRRYEDKRNGVEPLTDAPEELAWDEPLPLSPAEDPNFKNSDLNNAMSIRNMARSFIKNMGMKEGADVRVGFITRFARKARGLFNPDSGIIRVRNIRDLRALTHEIGHWLDYEVFDIRGIISAKKADKQLGIGVDFNGNTYSNVAQVEKAMKNGIVTIDEGNYLLDKVKTFEKAKLGEKYSEIVEQTSIIPVKYKNKTYRTAKEITDALSKGVMKNTKASELIVKLNNNNKGRDQRIQKLRDKYGSDVVDGILQRNELKKEFDALLRDVGYPSNKRTEGIAEFVYNYVIDPKQLINSTPNALAWFEKMLDNAPEVKNALHKLREQFAEYDAQDIRTKVVAETKTPEKEKTPWLDGIVKIKDNLLYNWVNQLQHMRNLSDEWKKIVGNNAYAYKDPYISAKEIIGIDGRAQQWLLFHPYSRKGNEIIINEDIKGLMQIVKPLIGTADYEPYKAYLVALDSRESHNRNKPEQAYLSRDVADAAIKAFEKQYGVQKLWDFQKSIQTYNEALLDFSAESGRISKETAEYWKNEHQYYVPLRRIAETYEMMGGKRRTITRDMLPESERAIFTRKGSAKQIKDIFESMIDNTYRILASSERNLLNRNIADAFKDIHDYNRKNNIKGAVIEEIDARGMEAYQDPTTGEIRYAISKIRPKNFRPPKGRILTVFEEGKPRFYDVAPEYYDPIFQVTMQMSGMMEKIIKVATAPSRWLQAGAVIYDPTFPIRNIVRDQQSAWFYSKHGYLPTDFIKGLMSFVKKDQYYQKWLASGGDQSFLVSADMMMSEEYVSHKIGSLTRRKFDAYKRNPLLALQDFSRASEIGTRLGAFRNAYKKTGNVHLAAIESRDISADYGIKGATIRHAVQFYPFLNPRIQHARMTAEAMKNPAAFMAKGLALTIPAIMNWLINNQDEESRKLYQSLPTWRRVGLYNIRIPGTDHFLPLPKGFFGTLFASSVESVLDATLKEDPRVLDELPKQLFQEISPVGNMTEMVPFPIRPLVEMWANKKGYTGKPIVSESMKMLKPSEQYYNSTPEIIKKLGEALNWSPVKIEHYFRSYTGGAGIGAVNILDETLQAIGLVDKKPEDTFTMLSRMPVFKALLTEKPIGLASGYISDFYETLDKIEQVNVTFNNFVKTENYDALDKFMSDPENKRMYSFYEGNSTALNAFRSVLTYARDSMYAVMKDDLLTKGEKQDEVEKINRIIQESAIKFKDAYENKKFFDYGSAMDEIITRMKSEKKDYRKELIQQQNSYNPYWIQLRGDNKAVYDRLMEFGGLRDIEQTKPINVNGEKVTLELEDVRRFNEEVVKKYGENVKNMIGTDKATYEGYQKITNPMNPEQTQLQQILDSAWETAMSQTASTFVPQTPNKVK